MQIVESFFSIYVKNAIVIMIGTALSLLIALCGKDILKILAFLSPEHGISFHLFMFFHSVSFQYIDHLPPWLNVFLGILLSLIQL